MKVMHVMAGADVGGAERIFLDNVLALADEGVVEQAVVTRDEPYRVESLRSRNIPVYTAGFNKWFRFVTAHVLRKAIAEFEPDMIQYWMGRAGTFAVKGSHVNVAWYGGYYNPERRFFNCEYHLAMTADIRNHIIDKGISPEKVGILHTLANLNEDAVPVSRAEFDTPDHAPLLLALGRLHWKKGFDVLLNAMTGLPDCYAWIAGEGPLREEIEKQIKELGLSERVRLLGWRNDREELLKTCDICVFPSRYEPFGNVTVEAWAMKKPLVVTASQGPKAYVRHGENGMLVEIDDVDGLRDSIKTVLENPDVAEKIICGGYEDYVNIFSLPAFLKGCKALYERVLDGSSIDPDVM